MTEQTFTMNSQDLRIIDELKTIDEKLVKPNRLYWWELSKQISFIHGPVMHEEVAKIRLTVLIFKYLSIVQF